MALWPQISPEPVKWVRRVEPLVLAPTGLPVLGRSRLVPSVATSVRGDRSIPAASPAVGTLCWALGSPQTAAEHLGGLPGPWGAPYTAWGPMPGQG